MPIKDSTLNVVIKAQDEATATLVKFQTQLNDLGRAANDAAQGGLDRLEKDIEGIDNAARRAAAGGLDGVADDIGDVGRESNKATPKIAKFGERQRTLLEKLRLQALQQPGRAAARDIRRVGTAAQETAVKTRGLGGVLSRFIGGFVAFEGLRRVSTSIIKTGDTFEKLGIQLEAVEGSAKGARDALDFVEDFTKKTPLQLEQVTEAYTKLRNFGIDPTNGTLQALVDQNEKLGGGYDRLNGLILATGQAWAKSKLQGEEILQLVERGVPVWELLEKATGKNVTELQKLSAAGKLGRKEIALLVDAIGEASSGAAVANMGTFSGLVSNLSDSWSRFANTVAEAGVLDYLKAQLTIVTEKIAEFKRTGQLDKFAKQISDNMIVAIEALKGLAAAAKVAVDNAGLLITAWAGFKVAALVRGVTGFAAALGAKGLAGATATATVATTALTAAMRLVPYVALAAVVVDLGSKIKDLVLAKKDLASSNTLLASAQEEETRRIEDFNKQTGQAVKSVDEMFAQIQAGTAVLNESTGQWITGTEAVDEYKTKLGETKEEFAGLSDAFSQGVEAFQAVRAEAESSKDALDEVFGNYDLKVADDIFFLGNTLKQLSRDSAITAQDINDSLGEALSEFTATELADFQAAVERAFKLGALDAETFATVIDGTVSQALTRLGVDITKAEENISSVGKEGIAAFESIVKNIKNTGDTAEVQSRKVAAAFDGALEQISTNQGFEILKQSLVGAAQAGVISAAEYEKKLKELIAAQKELKEATDGSVQSTRELSAAASEIDAAGVGELEGGAKRAGSAMGAVAGIGNGLINQMKQLGPAALNAYNKMIGGANAAAAATGSLNEKLAQAQSNLARLSEYKVGSFGITSALNEMGRAAERVKIAFYSQKIGVQNLEAAYRNGTMELADFIYQSERAIRNSGLLGQQDLGPLRSAIASAKAEMQSFGEQTEDTLARLEDRLDTLQGNTDAIRQRQFLRDIAQLEADAAKARANRDEESYRNLVRALDIRRQINREEVAASERDKREREARERETNSRNNKPLPPRPRSPTLPSPNSEISPVQPRSNLGSNQVVTLNLQVQGSSVGTLTNIDQGELERIIQALELSGLTGG